jgi:hypothetical protein
MRGNNETKRPSRVRRLAVVASVLVPLMFMGGEAFATGGTVSTAITSGFSGLQTLIVGVIAVAAFAITVAGVGISLGIKWLRSKAKSAN